MNSETFSLTEQSYLGVLLAVQMKSETSDNFEGFHRFQPVATIGVGPPLVAVEDLMVKQESLVLAKY